MIKLQCPDCHKHFKLGSPLKIEDMPIDCTLDCPYEACGSLLFWKDKKVHNFHRYMNQQDPKWPKDGKNTGYVSF